MNILIIYLLYLFIFIFFASKNKVDQDKLFVIYSDYVMILLVRPA